MTSREVSSRARTGLSVLGFGLRPQRHSEPAARVTRGIVRDHPLPGGIRRPHAKNEAPAHERSRACRANVSPEVNRPHRSNYKPTSTGFQSATGWNCP